MAYIIHTRRPTTKYPVRINILQWNKEPVTALTIVIGRTETCSHYRDMFRPLLGHYQAMQVKSLCINEANILYKHCYN
jgi:hypothetical protein